ncbi:Phosphatidylinositide phosphatase [Lachnellula suecica]|uniref:Phosphatidylinositide phosphatase n=1 Tax=Lachnellula suecica TaxID=602035 RepID=A0A8T9CF58_9HELO|nr:Phosphatidylinositide phosphatase [Lachnellula suecica]
MPGLVRKLLIFAAVDGLILQPLAQKGQRPASAAKISYNEQHSIAPVTKDEGEGEDSSKSFEAFGIVGLLTVSKSSFLISITRRQQVAIVQGKPIFAITEVALTPLASRAEADAAITHTQKSLQRKATDNNGLEDSDTEGEEEEVSTVSDDVEDDESHPAAVGPVTGEHKRSSSVAEDVMARKGGYGRFAKKWFSKKGWTADQRRNLGMTASESDDNPPKVTTAVATDGGNDISGASTTAGSSSKDRMDKDSAASLLPKLLRTTQILFGTSRSFYFSYDYDITRSLLNRQILNPELPLHTQVDPLFFWNMKIIQPFIDAGQSSFVMPLMQGFIGQQEFEMDTEPPKPIIGLDGPDQKSSMEMTDMSPSHKIPDPVEVPATDGSSDIPKFSDIPPSKSMKPYLITLISRRSVKRAGLRYLRRGVDDEGHTANSVETEQILSDPEWKPSSKVHSFVQIRGSIPVFFSQSPFSFKPVPQVQHSTETNYQAFVKHFENVSDRYGSVQVASLVERHGPEAIVGDKYEQLMTRLNESGGIKGSPVAFEWFDFHSACRGMKFENVSLLMDALGEKLDTFGYTVEQDGIQVSRQSGVLRTNCMDCLDRTNVVQNSFGKRALELQLKTEGIDLSLQQDQTAQWFNILWADNGDAISKQYASTAALKGDFTRTRKRDYKGALTDMGLSISRFYSGIVNDYFSQAAIDFLLGNVTSVVFEDFETSMMSRDPAVSMYKMRQQAIEACQKLVVADEHEEFIGGWTLLAPHMPNTIKSMPFEESVLLLTDSGLYSCRFDWNLEKVSSFERVSLEHIINIKYGTYITSTLSASQADEQRNVGFVVTYTAGANDITRVNTRSMSSLSRPSTDLPSSTSPSTSTSTSGLASLIQGTTSATTTNKVLALKALPSRDAAAEGHESRLSEVEQVKTICAEIERMVLHGQVVEVGTERRALVEGGDIISLAEARKSTGLLEQLGHSFKKLIWA